MSKKEVTREEKFEDYRNSIENSQIKEKVNDRSKKKDTSKPTLKPLIVNYNKQVRKRRISYLLFVSLFAIISIFILIYFGVKIYG